MQGINFVWHLAANADVRFGTQQTHLDLEQNTIVTFNVLEAMRENNIKKIVFSSTGAIYGESRIIPTPEDCPMPIQTSLYGASKLSCESMIQAYCEGFNFQAWIFRFVSVLGERYTHGHVYDFYEKLLTNPDSLGILGDGHQTKSYIYVHDCIEAMILGIEKANEKVNVINLGTSETIEVFDSIKVITEFMGINPKIIAQDSIRGWIGDSPMIYLDTSKMNSYGWEPSVSIRDGIIKTLEWLKGSEWLFKGASKKNL